MPEEAIVVSYESIRLWCARLGPPMDVVLPAALWPAGC